MMILFLFPFLQCDDNTLCTLSVISPKDTLCTLESVKAVGEVYAPVDCEAVQGTVSIDI